MEEIDVHGMSVLEAKKVIEKLLASLPKDVKELRVIHGYSSGNEIKKMVQDRNSLRSKRIMARKYTKNPGETILLLV
ncbi:MAG: Smr/MutS family protein [Candidatus Izemoplasmataceae bacterium]